METAVRVVDRREIVVGAVRLVAVVVVVLVVYFVAPFGERSSAAAFVRAAISFLLLGGVIAFETIGVVRSDRPGRRAVRALTVMFSLLVVVSASIHLAISTSNSGAFTEPLDHVDALYLSMMTLTTVGFGDIGAVSTGARIAVMFQMVFNVLTIGIAGKVVVGRVQRARGAAELR